MRDVTPTNVEELVEAIPDEYSRQREAALEQGEGRTNKVMQAVRAAMRVIEDAIADNEDIYPENKGVVNKRELARRAGIHYTTLHGTKYEAFLEKEVDTWLKNLERKATISKLEVQRTLAERVSDWKELCGAFVDAIRISELDRQQAEGEREEMASALKQAQGERDALHRMLQVVKEESERLQLASKAATGGRVVPLHRGQPGGKPTTGGQ